MLNKLFRFDFGRLDDGWPRAGFPAWRYRKYRLEYTVEDVGGIEREIIIIDDVSQLFDRWAVAGGKLAWAVAGGKWAWAVVSDCGSRVSSENLWAREKLKQVVNEPVEAHDMIWPASSIRRIRFVWLDEPKRLSA